MFSLGCSAAISGKKYSCHGDRGIMGMADTTITPGIKLCFVTRLYLDKLDLITFTPGVDVYPVST